MSLPALEDFAGTGALSGNWSISVGTVERTSDHCDFGASFSYAFWTGDAFNDDQKAQAVLGATGMPATQTYSGVTVRAAGPNSAFFNNYFLYVDGTNAYLFKTVLGSGSLIATFVGESVHFNTYRLEVEGTTLRAYREGVQIGTDQTDSSLQQGYPGIGGLDVGATVADDWLGDNLVAAPSNDLFRELHEPTLASTAF